MSTAVTQTPRTPQSLFLALLVLLVWLPLPLGSDRPWAWSLMELAVFLLTARWLHGLGHGHWTLSPALRETRWMLLALAIWLAWGALQLVPLPPSLLEILSPESLARRLAAGQATTDWHPLSLAPANTVDAWLKGLAYGLVLVLTLALVDNRKRLEIMAQTLVLAAVFQGMLASLQSLGGWEFLWLEDTGVAHGTFVNRNHLAGYLVMNLSLGIGLLIARMNHGGEIRTWRQRLREAARVMLGPKARLRLYLAIMVITLVLTHSRMGNTSFFVAMLVAGGVALLLFRHPPRPVVVLIASLLVVDIFIVGTWFGVEKVKKRIQETQLSTETRDEVDVYVWEMWKDYPLTGSGAGSFYAVFPRYREADVGPGFYDHAHNDYLEILSESGIIGALPLGSTVLISLGAALLAQRRRRDPLMRGMGFAATMSIVAMLIHSGVDFNLQIPANAAEFMVILALPWLALTLGRQPP